MRPRLTFLPLLLLVAGCAHPVPSGPRVLLLGEVHDNPTGHAARAAMLRDEVAAGWRPVIAMEQFDTGQQSALDAAMRECRDAACVIGKVAPGKSGWTWAHYAPLITLALQYGLPVRAANLSRADASKVVKEGFAAALPADLIARYQLDSVPASLLAAQETEVRDSHCGILPETMVAPMAKAQVARDVVMAEAMRQPATDGVVLIAGNGHVRRDIGVPFWLRRGGMESRSVGFVEDGGHARAFDSVRRIPAFARPPPCEGFKPPRAG
jgi:uncharacterized iron-regulated protein